MNKEMNISKLSKDEAGKLRGGFSIEFAKVDTHIFASNGNCLGGGWGDTNTNCTGACSACSVTPQVPTTNKPGEQIETL